MTKGSRSMAEEPARSVSRAGIQSYSTNSDPTRANALGFSPDGKLLATSERLPGQGREAELKIWEVATAKQLHSLPGTRGRVLAIAFRPDGRLMATLES